MADDKTKPADPKAAPPKIAKDSIAKGTVDLMPVLYLDARALCAAIAAGEHDGCLTELCELEAGHRKRDQVIDALKARGAKPPKG